MRLLPTGITVNPTSSLTTTEAGGANTFTVVLTSEPTADVTIGLSSSDTTEGTVSPSSLTFTSASWNTPQTVTITGVNDDVDDGNIAYTIVTAAVSSGDPNWNGLNPSDVSVSNTDDDEPAGGGMSAEWYSPLTLPAGGFAILINNGDEYTNNLIETPNYPVYQSETFSIKEGSGIHQNIELKSKYWWLKIIDWKIVVVILFGVLLLHDFYKMRDRIIHNS